MLKNSCLWSVVLILGALSASAHKAPEAGGPDGPPEMMGGPAGGGPEGGPRDGRIGPGGEGFRSGGPGGGMDMELTEAQEKELLDFVKANDPIMAEHLARENGHGAPSYKHQIFGLWRMYKDSADRERWVKQARAHREIREISTQYNKAPDGEKPALKDRLKKAVGDLFDADLADKTRQVEAMEAHAATFKEKIAKRREAKDRMVNQRVEQITGESGEDWQW